MSCWRTGRQHPGGRPPQGRTLLSGQADPRRHEPRPTLRAEDTPRRESDRFRVRPRFSLRPYANRRPRGHQPFNTGIAFILTRLRLGRSRWRRRTGPTSPAPRSAPPRTRSPTRRRCGRSTRRRSARRARPPRRRKRGRRDAVQKTGVHRHRGPRSSFGPVVRHPPIERSDLGDTSSRTAARVKPDRHDPFGQRDRATRPHEDERAIVRTAAAGRPRLGGCDRPCRRRSGPTVTTYTSPTKAPAPRCSSIWIPSIASARPSRWRRLCPDQSERRQLGLCSDLAGLVAF